MVQAKEKKAKPEKEKKPPKEKGEKKPPKEKKVKEPVEGKKKRAKKDKNAPKKGMSSYMFFLNSSREQVRKPIHLP